METRLFTLPLAEFSMPRYSLVSVTCHRVSRTPCFQSNILLERLFLSYLHLGKRHKNKNVRMLYHFSKSFPGSSYTMAAGTFVAHLWQQAGGGATFYCQAESSDKKASFSKCCSSLAPCRALLRGRKLAS